MSKHDYIEYIANYLVEISVEGATCIPKRIFNPSSQMRLTERHFLKKYPFVMGRSMAFCAEHAISHVHN